MSLAHRRWGADIESGKTTRQAELRRRLSRCAAAVVDPPGDATWVGRRRTGPESLLAPGEWWEM